MILSRGDDMKTTGHKHNLEVDYEVTGDESGQIVDVKLNAQTNGGASLDMTLFWNLCLLERLDGGYTFRKFDGHASSLRTNTVSNTAFRGFGGPEGITMISPLINVNVNCFRRICGRDVDGALGSRLEDGSGEAEGVELDQDGRLVALQRQHRQRMFSGGMLARGE